MATSPTTRPHPPAAALEAFGLDGPALPLPGGQGTAWRAGDAVLKPLDGPASEVRWRGELLARLDGRDDFRVSVPLRTTSGAWTSSGWTASRYEPGAHLAGRWLDVVEVGRRFSAALDGVPEPAFLARRTDAWATADRVAWGELDPPLPAPSPTVARASAALRPVSAPSQLVHGDLTGNVLFSDHLPPLVIDLSPYWRPPAFASAVVVADALVVGGADEGVLEPVLQEPDFLQHLLRALVFRAVTDRILRTDAPGPGEDAYAPVVEAVLRRLRSAGGGPGHRRVAARRRGGAGGPGEV